MERASTSSGGPAELAPGVSVVVPCYRSEATLPQLVEELAKTLPACGERYEAILVNDGSPGRTWEVIRGLADRYPWVRGYNLMRNYGQHNATLCGIRAARFDVTVTIDDDLENLPSQIPKLLAALRTDVDVVYGKPERRQKSVLHRVAAFFVKALVARSLQISNLADASAFRAFRTDLRRAFERFNHPRAVIEILLSWGTTRVDSVVVEFRPRGAGRSGYRLSRLANDVLLTLTIASTAPLRLASYVGFLSTLFGFGLLVWVVASYLIQGSIPGFPLLASAISFFGGAQLFCMGLFGEYLARLYQNSFDSPTYVVDEQTAPVARAVSQNVPQESR